MRRLLILAVCLAILCGCGAEATPSQVVRQVVVTVKVTATPLPPTDTPEPTDTPTATDTLTPTDTPAPTDTPQPTRTPLPTATKGPTKTLRPTNTPPPPTATPIPPTKAPTQPPTATPTPEPSKPPVARVVIADVYNKSYTEYVEITNQGDGPADMSRWFVHGSKGDETYTFPDGYILPAETTMRLHSGDNGVDAPPLDIYWTDKTVWNNDGETVYLKDAQGNLVDDFSW